MQIGELANLLTQNSRDESVNEVPWAIGEKQQAERIMYVAQWAAFNASGDLCQVTSAVNGITVGLAAVARLYNRKLYIIVPWGNLDPESPLHTVPRDIDELAEDLLYLVKPFGDIITLLTKRQTGYGFGDLCFSFVQSPPDLETIQHDILAAKDSWLIAVDNATWEQTAMAAMLNTRFLLNRGVLIRCANREAYLTRQP